jgi:hypothetical protein
MASLSIIGRSNFSFIQHKVEKFSLSVELLFGWKTHRPTQGYEVSSTWNACLDRIQMAQHKFMKFS